MQNKKAVLFDVGGTLIYPYPSVGELYAQGANEFGIELNADEAKKRFFAGWVKAKSQWKKPIKYGRTENEAKEFWFEVVKASFDGIISNGKIAELFEHLYYLFAKDNIWRCYPEVINTIKKLKGEGYTLGILSNWDTRLAPILKALGISELMDHVFISCDIGYEKPDSRAFSHALSNMKLSNQELLYVGNDYEEDYLPSKELGISTVLIKRGDHIEPGDDIPFIQSLTEIYNYI